MKASIVTTTMQLAAAAEKLESRPRDSAPHMRTAPSATATKTIMIIVGRPNSIAMAATVVGTMEFNSPTVA